jgi:hypothetical protein
MRPVVWRLRDAPANRRSRRRGGARAGERRLATMLDRDQRVRVDRLGASRRRVDIRAGGVQKLVFPEILGAGRFAGIGIPWPEVMGPFVGWVEMVCGALILLGLFTRLAAVPLIITMVVALKRHRIVPRPPDWQC